jgi:hypothetical protein
MRQTLFEAVSNAHDRTGQQRRRLAGPDDENCPVDAAFAMAHHASDQSRRLKPGEPFCGRPHIQTTVGIVDGYQPSIHDFWTHGTNGESCGKEIIESPDTRVRMEKAPHEEQRSPFW